jgi:hypothetical protein
VAIGEVRLGSESTRECATLTFGVLHLGDHDVTGGIRQPKGPEGYDKLKKRLADPFSKADTAAMIRILDEEFDRNMYSLRTLFQDERRRIVNLILNDSLISATAAYRGIYENHASLIRFLNGVGIPVPAEFQSAADIALNSQLRQVFERPELDADGIRTLLKEAANSKVSLDVTTLEFVIRKKLEKEADNFATDSGNFEAARRLRKLLEFISPLPFPVVLREAQNVAYGPLVKDMKEHRPEAEKGNPIDQNWMHELGVLREMLRIQNA